MFWGKGRRYKTKRIKKKVRRASVGCRGKCELSWLCVQNTLKREEKPGLAGPTKLPLASLQFCERTCVIPQAPVSSILTIAKIQHGWKFTKMRWWKKKSLYKESWECELVEGDANLWICPASRANASTHMHAWNNIRTKKKKSVLFWNVGHTHIVREQLSWDCEPCIKY